jgi:CRISPR-associated protein Cmr3
MQTINIQATDTLFFRDGRPFTMGEDSYAESAHFPPLPSVIYGALRSAYMGQHIDNQSIKELIEITDQLVIKAIALRLSLNDGEIYFPIPKDLVVSKGKTTATKLDRKPLPISNKQQFCSEMLVSSKNEKLEDSTHIITRGTLRNYLDQKNIDLPCKKLSHFLSVEPKLGISRNKETHTSENSLLYRIGMVRPEIKQEKELIQLGIAVCFDNLSIDINEKQLLQLGGERKTAIAQAETENLILKMPKNIDEKVGFKIYLATPAIFEAGWYPKLFLETFNLDLITAALDKPIHVGGWDIDKNEPKPMRQAVPAGSVYYVKPQENRPNKIREAIQFIENQHSISELNTAKQGFGIAFVGKI